MNYGIIRMVGIAGILTLLLTVTAWADTYVVCVGIGNYKEPKVENLRKTEADAKAMADFFRRGTDNVITITGKYATKLQIMKSLKSQFSRAKADDKIIFYFSGHGYPGGFCPYEMSKLEEGLTYAEVLEIMRDSKAKTKMIFADACNSGAIRQKGREASPNAGNVLMFMSSRASEYSVENNFLSNGYFTKHLLRGLGGGADSNGDRRITAKELFRYVSEGVKRQTEGRQHPVMWGNFDDDLTIVEYRKN